MAHHARAVSANRIFALAGVVLVLVFVFMVSHVFDRPTQTALRSEVKATSAYDTARAATTLDTDSDGMPDWEETLLGTDPNNADENANGVKDGSERGELVARLNPPSDMQHMTSSTTEGFGSGSLTDMVARNMMGEVMQSFKNKEHVGDEAVNDLLARSIDEMSDVATVPLYTKEDVVTVPASPEARLAYLESVRVNLLDALKKKPSEYNALSLIVHNMRKEGVQELTESVAIYESAAEALRNVPVPEDAVDTHVLLVSGILEYADSLKKISQFEKDPMLGVIGLNAFGIGQSKFAVALNVYTQYTTDQPKKLDEETLVESVKKYYESLKGK